MVKPCACDTKQKAHENRDRLGLLTTQGLASLSAEQRATVQPAAVTMAHMRAARAASKATVGRDDLGRFLQYREEFGTS